MNKDNEKEVKAAEVEEPVAVLPVCDVIEQAHAVKVLLEMAGVEPDEVEINVDNRVLTVSGDSVLRHEGRPIRYRRSFQLSEEIDSGRISAKAKNGVLELLLPKHEAAKVHKVKVSTE